MKYFFMVFLLFVFTAVFSPAIHAEENIAHVQQQLKELKQQYRHVKQDSVRLHAEGSELQWFQHERKKSVNPAGDLLRQQRQNKMILDRLSQEIERADRKLYRAEQSVNH